jgi:hypothetical protein
VVPTQACLDASAEGSVGRGVSSVLAAATSCGFEARCVLYRFALAKWSLAAQAFGLAASRGLSVVATPPWFSEAQLVAATRALVSWLAAWVRPPVDFEPGSSSSCVATQWRHCSEDCPSSDTGLALRLHFRWNRGLRFA